LAFDSPVLNLKILKTQSYERLVVATQSEIHLFELSNLSKISTIPVERTNPKGLINLSFNDPILAYTRTPSQGDLVLYDLANLQSRKTFDKLHPYPLSAIEFSFDGNFLATTDEYGQVIKVLQLKKNHDCIDFRRGVTSAEICSVAFSGMNCGYRVPLLAVSSTNGTVHIFKIETPKPTDSLYGTVLSGLAAVTVGAEERSFCKITLTRGLKSSVAFNEEATRVFVVSNDGMFSQWEIVSTGDCKIIKQEPLLQDSDYNFESDAER